MKPTTPNSRGILYCANRRPCAIVGSMKLILLVLVVFVAASSARAQISPLQQGLVLKSGVREPTAAEIAAQKKRADAEAAGTNLIRLVEGKAYHVLNSTNWITLPAKSQRAKFSRPSPAGPIFEIENYNIVRFGPSLGDGGRVWYAFDREVIITNYPSKKLIAGDILPAVRVMPVRTTESGIAVYDHGTPPVQPKRP